MKQKLEGQDHQQHSRNGSTQQLHPAIEVTGIFPTPTKAGDAQRQTRHGVGAAASDLRVLAIMMTPFY